MSGPSHHVRRLLIACLLLAGCGSPAQPQTPPPRGEALWPQPERYDVDARWARNRLAGDLTITFTNTSPAPLREVWLRTWPNAFGSCRRPLATLSVTGGGRAGARRARCTAQQVRLDREVAPGERGTIGVEFAVRVPRSEDRFGRSANGVAYLGNALPTLAVADRDGWRLPPYFDRGEAWFTLVADWRVRLRVPDGLTVAATGTERAPGVHEAERARDFMIAVGRLRTVTIRVGAITVRHLRPPGQPAAQARRALRAARASLERYQRWFGPYGRRELDVVQGPARVATGAVAMEYPELVLAPAVEAPVAHEVAHQWWAFQMGNDPYREPFLDEAFAEYAASRIPRSITGGHRLGRCARPKRPPRPPLSADVPAFRRAGGRAYVRVVYFAGACMLRRLERELGRERFDEMLRELVREHRDRTWTRADLIAAIDRAAPAGFDVDAFLRREGVAPD